MTGFSQPPCVCLTHKAWQIASLEGYLVKYKASPQACVEGVAKWYGVMIHVVVKGILP